MFDIEDEDYDGQDVNRADRAQFWYGYILALLFLISVGIALVVHHWS